MDNLYGGVMLLAQSALNRMGSRIRGDHAKLGASDVLVVLAIVAIVVAGIWVLTRLIARQDRDRRYHNPRALFRELCRTHQLNTKERRFLRQVATYQRLKQPALLFVQPDRLQPSELGRHQRAQKALLKTLRKQLFGDVAAPPRSEPEQSSK